MKRVIGFMLVTAVMLTVSVSWASAASVPFTVRIERPKVTLLADGTVAVPLRARCPTELATFELDVSVTQGGTIGAVTTVEAGVVPCDGRWQRTAVTVTAELGGTSFVSGTATVGVFLGAFDGQSDVEVTDSATVTL